MKSIGIFTSALLITCSLIIISFTTPSSESMYYLPEKGKDTVDEKISTNANGKGQELVFHFKSGKKHSNALIAIWIEDMNESYLQTLYVSESIAKGVFKRVTAVGNKWESGEARRPAALPYWGHKRGIAEEDGLYVPTPKSPVPDAYSGATPQGSFTLTTKTDKRLDQKFRIFFEINQPFDFNEFWANTKFSDDSDYRTSGQPSLVYSVTVDPSDSDPVYYLNPVGHGHYSGKSGKLYTNLSTITTALQIVSEITVSIEATK